MKVAIITYSTYGHINTLAQQVKEGLESVSTTTKADIFRVPETLSDNVLQLIHAPAKPEDIQIATLKTLEEYDAFVLGIPTRFGAPPAQFTSFWDQTGGLWASGALAGKPVAFFVSTGGLGGGQESTIRTVLSVFVHHGLIYIPLGYASSFAELSNLETVHGGSAWGAGTIAGPDGSKTPNDLELTIARNQGEAFAKSAIKFVHEEPVEEKAEVLDSEVKQSSDVAEVADKNTARNEQSTVAKEQEKEKSGCGVKCVIS